MPERELDVAEMPSLTPVSTMEPVDLVQADGGVPLTGRRARQGRLGVVGWLALVWLVLVVLLAVLAPVLPIDDPNEVTASIARQPTGHRRPHPRRRRPRPRHARRLVYGARASLLIGVGCRSLLGLVLGGLLGLIAGYFRGKPDTVLTGVLRRPARVPAARPGAHARHRVRLGRAASAATPARWSC